MKTPGVRAVFSAVAFCLYSSLGVAQDPPSPDSIEQRQHIQSIYTKTQLAVELAREDMVESRVDVSLMLDDHLAVEGCNGDIHTEQMARANDVMKATMLNRYREGSLYEYFGDRNSDIMKLYAKVQKPEEITSRLDDAQKRIEGAMVEYDAIKQQLLSVGCTLYEIPDEAISMIEHLAAKEVAYETYSFSLSILKRTLERLE